MKKKTKVFIILWISLLVVAACCSYIYAVYHGYVPLNIPSKSKFPVKGVDVSHYQGEIDWNLLSQQDIRFAYIKATEGSSHVDDKFAVNWEAAYKTGLKSGAYHFFSFDSPGQKQAENYISQVDIREGMLPPAIDAEYYADKKVNPPDVRMVQENLQSMLDIIEEHYKMVPVIYSTEEFWNIYLKGNFERYPLWIRNVITKPRIDSDWIMWQYSNRGRLEGYTGQEEYIDLNVFNGSLDTWNLWSGQ